MLILCIVFHFRVVHRSDSLREPSSCRFTCVRERLVVQVSSPAVFTLATGWLARQVRPSFPLSERISDSWLPVVVSHQSCFCCDLIT